MKIRKKIIKKLLSIVMVLLLTVNFVPMYSYAEFNSIDNAQINVNNAESNQKKTVEVKQVQNGVVKADIENGTVRLNEVEVSKLDVLEASEVSVEIIPVSGWIIQSVTVNDESEKITNVNAFTKNIIVNENIEIFVEFIELHDNLNLTVKSGANGKVSFDNTAIVTEASVEYQGNITTVIYPDNNYRVKNIFVNNSSDEAATGASIDLNNDENYIEKSDNTSEYVLNNITTDTAIYVEFEEINDLSDLITDAESLENYISVKAVSGELKNVYTETSGNSIVYVYSNNSQVELKPVSGTVFDEISTENKNSDVNGEWKTSEIVTQSCEITELKVRKNKGQNTSSLISGKTIKIIIDNDAPTLTVNPQSEASDDGYYNKDIILNILASDDNKNSESTGICKIEYKVESLLQKTNEIIETQRVILYETSGNSFGISNFVSDGAIVIDAEKNNSDYVTLTAVVTDYAGNVTTVEKSYKINISVPEINIDISGGKKEEAEDGYYTSREAVITITDRDTTFDENAVLEGLNIIAKDYSGKEISINKNVKLSEWSTGEYNGDETTHQAVLVFDTDAIYEWTVSYTNKAESTVSTDTNSNNLNVSGDSVWKFTVDNESPENVSIEVADKGVWKKIIDTLTFNVFSGKEGVIVLAKASDRISPVKDIVYYKSTDCKVLNLSELNELYENGKFSDSVVSVKNDEAFIVYARITDKAGNTVYISTDGIIVDTLQSLISVKPVEYKNIYSTNVAVSIDADENRLLDIKSSGIKEVNYSVVCNGTETQSGNLYTYNINNPLQTQTVSGKAVIDDTTKLVNKFTDTIIVDAEKNNSSDVIVKVNVEDNAGNVSEESIVLDIDITSPQINISYDNNDANMVEADKGYFPEYRTATIQIKERTNHFDAEKAGKSIKITAKDFDGNNIECNPIISDWSTVEGIEPDESLHTATVTFNKDANYNVEIEYVDEAGNVNKAIDTGNSITPYCFAVDKKSPNGKIIIDKNSWTKLINVLTFGLFSKSTFNISEEDEDAISGVAKKEACLIETTELSADILDKLQAGSWQEFEEFVKNFKENTMLNKRFVICLKLTDKAGNYSYISSDGQVIDNVKSEITLSASGNVSKLVKQNNLYNEDVKVQINVNENGDKYSGIQKIKYWVTSDNIKTQEEILYSFDYDRETGENISGGALNIYDNSKTDSYYGEVPTVQQLKGDWSGAIVVDAEKNNSSNVVVNVEVTDNAGNVNIESINLDIDITNPEISVSYNNNNANMIEGNKGHFPENRTATIQIKERTNHFSEEKAGNSIKISAKDSKGNDIDCTGAIGNWVTTEGDKPDDALHIVTITYDKDANYKFDITYTDEAGNVNKSVNTKDSVTPYEFSVDKEIPEGIIYSQTSEGRNDNWNSLADRLTFGIWSADKISITAQTNDKTSGVASVKYYKTGDTSAKSISELNNISDWKDFNDFSIESNEQAVVYLKIADKAGNIKYISTDGMIVDSSAPRVESIAPEISINPEQPVNDIYNGNVNVYIEVHEPLEGNTYSGIKTISYRILNMGKETQSGVLYSFDNSSPVQSELQKDWSGNITVDSELNNSNDVVIEVYAQDNSLNSSVNSEQIKIDITKPVIRISYDNNNPDSGKYYNNSRTATIVVTERNFNPENIETKITNTDGVVPLLSNWSYEEGTGNNDNTTYTATILYDADGDYTFDINYSDLAGNQCEEKIYSSGTSNATEFTIDKTIPVIEVSYNNNSFANDKYFKQDRTATISIKEHNFDESRVNFTQSASLNGLPIAVPKVVWSSNGDLHTATIVYDTDGDYTFDVSMTDMAGNTNNGVNYKTESTSKSFTIDKKIEKPVISGIETGKAYKGDVIPVIEFSDINYSSYSITLTRTHIDTDNIDETDDSKIRENINADVTDIFIPTEKRVITEQNGKIVIDTLNDENVNNDGIYNLKVEITDKAGNATEENITFTLNRFGSVFSYDEYFISLIEDKYIKKVNEDIVITEYNADEISNSSIEVEITRDGKPLDEVKYDITPKVNETVQIGETGWYQCEYRIDASNFKQDGVYKMAVFSKDKNGNTSENVPDRTNHKKNLAVFSVDSTSPEITSISGLEEKIINAQEVNVNYDVFDAIGLASIQIYVNDDKITIDGDNLSDLNNYSGSFVVKDSDKQQKVRMVVTDYAGNSVDTDSDDFSKNCKYAFNNRITVSTDFWVRFRANKVAVWGSVLGIIVIIAGVTAGVIFFRKKKSSAEEENNVQN